MFVRVRVRDCLVWKDHADACTTSRQTGTLLGAHTASSAASDVPGRCDGRDGAVAAALSRGVHRQGILHGELRLVIG
jgi:hypothetical protein